MTNGTWLNAPMISRRGLLKGTAGAAGLYALSSAVWLKEARAQAARTGFNWQRFKGESIEVVFPKGPRADLLMAHQKEFEELTGIKVGAEQIPEQQQRQKIVIEFTSGNTSFDVASISWHVQKRLVGKGKWMMDLREFLNDPNMTASDYDFSDFSKAGLTYATQADGRIDTLPQVIDYWILYWNQELFAKKGLAYPKSMAEIVTAAKALHDPANGIAGVVSRGLKNANVPVWTSLLLGWGVDSIDARGAMHTDGAEAVAAAEIYKTLNKDFAPAGVVGFNWNECQTTFSQGRAAMWIDGIGFAPPLEDPTKSRIVGRVGYGVTPPGPRAQHSAMFGDGIGVSAYTKKRGPAYFYCQWATNKMNQARILAGGAGAPCRNSAYADPTARANLKAPQGWVDALLESGKIGRPGLPVIVPVTEFRDIFGVALTNMIGGADAASELKKATEQFKPVLEKSEQA
jgi:multiple sugar transport system substrate-binding protein